MEISCLRGAFGVEIGCRFGCRETGFFDCCVVAWLGRDGCRGKHLVQLPMCFVKHCFSFCFECDNFVECHCENPVRNPARQYRPGRSYILAEILLDPEGALLCLP